MQRKNKVIFSAVFLLSVAIAVALSLTFSAKYNSTTATTSVEPVASTTANSSPQSAPSITSHLATNTGRPTTTRASSTVSPSTGRNESWKATLPPSALAFQSSNPSPSWILPAIQSSRPSGCRGVFPAGRSECNVTIFYAIADVPYNLTESLALPNQVLSIPESAEFLIHLGDIRSAAKSSNCLLSEYQEVATTLKLSRVPVFIVPGDNEWNDCKNVNSAWALWQQELSSFEEHWDHDFNVLRPADRPENFAFIRKRTLFIGLNLVGGRVHNKTEWTSRLSEQATWATALMKAHTRGSELVEQVRSIVVFGHANPTAQHDDFFLPLKLFIRDELDNTVPVLYLNGDAHVWSYNSSFYDVPQFLRMQLTGGTSEPPLQVIVSPSENDIDNFAQNVFLYDRRLNP